MALLKWIGWALGSLALVAVFVWSSSGAVRGYVTEIIWDRDSTLECTGGLQGDRLTLEGEDIESSADPLIFASGDCELRLIDSSIRAPTAIAASGSADVRVEGGRIEGAEAAIEASGRAVVRLVGTEVIGAQEEEEEGRIVRGDEGSASGPVRGAAGSGP